MTDTNPWMTKAEFAAWDPTGMNSAGFTERALELGWLAPRTSWRLEGTAIDPADLNPTTRYYWGWYGPAMGPALPNPFPITPSGSWSEMFP